MGEKWRGKFDRGYGEGTYGSGKGGRFLRSARNDRVAILVSTITSPFDFPLPFPYLCKYEGYLVLEKDFFVQGSALLDDIAF
jgi:hypothetical protein